MARSRRSRKGGDWTSGLPFAQRMAVKGAQAYGKHVVAPVTKYAVKQAVTRSGLATTPEVQAAKAAWSDMKSAWKSPMARPMANPYGRSAGPMAAPIPMAQPVPVATPVPVARPAAPAAPVAASAPPSSGTNSILVDALVDGLLWNEADTAYRAKLAKDAGRLAADIKKSTAWNQSLQDNLSALAKDVTALVKEQGVQPGPTSFRRVDEPFKTTVIESIGQLANPDFRAAVADRMARSARPAGDQRFLPGTINQLAAAIRNEVQKVAFGGRKTRRGRKARRATRRA